MPLSWTQWDVAQKHELARVIFIQVLSLGFGTWQRGVKRCKRTVEGCIYIREDQGPMWKGWCQASFFEKGHGNQMLLFFARSQRIHRPKSATTSAATTSVVFATAATTSPTSGRVSLWIMMFSCRCRELSGKTHIPSKGECSSNFQPGCGWFLVFSEHVRRLELKEAAPRLPMARTVDMQQMQTLHPRENVVVYIACQYIDTQFSGLFLTST